MSLPRQDDNTKLTREQQKKALIDARRAIFAKERAKRINDADLTSRQIPLTQEKLLQQENAIKKEEGKLAATQAIQEHAGYDESAIEKEIHRLQEKNALLETKIQSLEQSTKEMEQNNDLLNAYAATPNPSKEQREEAKNLLAKVEEKKILRDSSPLASRSIFAQPRQSSSVLSGSSFSRAISSAATFLTYALSSLIHLVAEICAAECEPNSYRHRCGKR